MTLNNLDSHERLFPFLTIDMPCPQVKASVVELILIRKGGVVSDIFDYRPYPITDLLVLLIVHIVNKVGVGVVNVIPRVNQLLNPFLCLMTISLRKLNGVEVKV